MLVHIHSRSVTTLALLVWGQRVLFACSLLSYSLTCIRCRQSSTWRFSSYEYHRRCVFYGCDSLIVPYYTARESRECCVARYTFPSGCVCVRFSEVRLHGDGRGRLRSCANNKLQHKAVVSAISRPIGNKMYSGLFTWFRKCAIRLFLTRTVGCILLWCR